MEKTRPTAHSTKRETLHQPQLKSPSVAEDADPFGVPANPSGGVGGEGGTPAVLFPKEKNERGGTPCHDLSVSFWVTLAVCPEVAPPPSIDVGGHSISHPEQYGTGHGKAYDKVLFTKNSLERKNLAPSRRHAQNSTLCLTSKKGQSRQLSF